MKLSFLGAAQQVTGSMYLLQTDDGYNILIDCGYDMEKEQPSAKTATVAKTPPKPTPVFPFEPSQIHVVVLTHAHIDHTGKLPLLYREGYEGQILCTTPTYYLSHILLEDSAQLHQRRFKRLMDKNRNKKHLPVEASEMYFGKQVEETMDQFVAVPLNQSFKITDTVSVHFYTAGHLLGAAHLYFKVKEQGTTKTICFSGDIGRFNYPLLPDPKPVPQADYVICETTYGNRLHKKNVVPTEALQQLIERTLITKGGKLIVPAFSVGRTQAFLYTLSVLYQQGQVPRFKVYSDSPMALRSSKVYESFVKQLNDDARDHFEDHDELFDFDELEYVHDLKQSKALSDQYHPCIIISSSGMIHGGRIEHHVAANLQNPKATIAIIGYCAEGTIGYELMQGAKEITIKNRKLEVRCDIEMLDCFSAHGDQEDLVHFMHHQDPKKVSQVFLTHGSEASMLAFEALLTEQGYPVIIPTKGSQFNL